MGTYLFTAKGDKIEFDISSEGPFSIEPGELIPDEGNSICYHQYTASKL